MTFKSALSLFIRKLWLTVAVLLVGFAVLLSVVRFSLPYLDHFRGDIETQLSQRFQQDIAIGSLSATWSGAGPALVLRDVRFDLDETNDVAFSVGNFSLGIDFWNSLWQRQVLFEHFELADVQLDIHYRQSTEVASFNELQATLAQLLLQQLEHFQLRNGVVTVHFAEQPPRSIDIQRLSWRREGSRRQAVGLFSIPDITANALNFIVDLEGDSFTAMSGSVFIEAQQLDISPWLQALTENSAINRAEFNLQGWLDFDNGRFGDGQLNFEQNILEWQSQESEHRLVTPATAWTLFPQEDGWVLNSAPMKVALNDLEWQFEQVTWQYQNGEHLWNVNDIELIDFSPLWNLFGSAGAALGSWLDGLQVGGNLQTLQVRLDEQRDWQFYANGRDLTWQPHRGVPGISGLQMEVWSSLQQGQFKLAGEEVRLISPATYNDAKLLSKMEVRGGWLQKNGQWNLDIDTAEFSLPGADIQQQMRFSGGTNQATEVDWLLTGGSTGMDLLDVVALLPLQLGENLGNYLTEALQDGDVDSLAMVWRGPLAGFPYRDAQGVLQAQAIINNLHYKFRQDWPAVENTQATLQFYEEQLDIRARGGELSDIPLTQVHAQIRDIAGNARRLHIAADVAASGSQLQQLFAASPLAGSVGGALERVYPAGTVTGAFTLDIPLAGDNTGVVAEGYVNLDNQDIFIEPVNLWLREVQGRLDFRNGDLSVTSDSALLLGLPVALVLTGKAMAGGYELQADVQGDWQMDAVRAQHAQVPLLDQMSGLAAWQADFNLAISEAGYQYQWLMNTDLTATDIRLPAPFMKFAGEERTLAIDVNGDENRLHAVADIAGVANLRGEMAIGSGGFHAMELQVGESPYTVGARSEPGFRIMAGLPEADLGEWLPVITTLTSAASQRIAGAEPSIAGAELEVIAEEESSGNAWVPALSRVDASIENMYWFGQNFKLTQMQGRSSGDGWLLDVNAENGRARIDWSTIGTGQLTIAADFLELESMAGLNEDAESEGAESAAVAMDRSWLDMLPSIIFTCRICRYEGREFGEVAMRLEPTMAGEQLRNFEVRKGNTVLQARGGWQGAGSELTSGVRGTFRSSNIGSYLNELGYNSIVRDSSANFNFDLHWQGALQDWNTDTLSGEVVWNFGAGYLRDVSDGGARIFSLLSLDSVLRKLTLDFRDIFARGMFYSSFGGTLELDNGVVSTNNTRMNGSAGDMSVRGYTNLLDESLNYQLSYVPKVTSSLPVLLAFMVNPPSGIAALVLDRVLHDAQVISRLEYEITGTISEPVVTEVKRDSREVELPEMGDDVLPRELPENTEAIREGGNE